LSLVDINSAHGLFDVLKLEAAHFGQAVAVAEQADTTTEQISWLSIAIESAFACCELCGRLRDIDPDRANEIANKWRDLAADYAVRRDEVVQNRKAELAGMA
jgi:hypothetical protein